MPFYDPSNWPLAKKIQENKEEILKEFHKCNELSFVAEKFNATTSFDTKLYNGYVGFLGVTMDTRLWSPEERKVYSEGLQKAFDRNRSLCPVASEIISQFPEIRQWYWNTLEPGGQVRPHYGVNGKIWNKVADHTRLQFCWEPGVDAKFYLEDAYIEYKEDLCFGFDDGMAIHWVKNNGDKFRSVLILDLWTDQCPDITWDQHPGIVRGNFTF